MVSRTIEGAQTRVEGYNFDMRKHVVEYDDVINRQRETIYRERDRILRSSDLGPTVLAMLDDEVAALVAEHTADDHPSDWNIDGLRAQLTSMVPSLTDADLAFLGRRERIRRRSPSSSASSCAEHYERKRVDDRRRGDDRPRAPRHAAGHRLAVGRAPHRRRRHAARHRPARLLAARAAQRVQDRGLQDVRRAEVDHPPRRHAHDLPRRAPAAGARQPRPMARNVTEGRAPSSGTRPVDTATRKAGMVPSGAREPARTGPKLGRNDPCWCGSGKKYKKCHGA